MADDWACRSDEVGGRSYRDAAWRYEDWSARWFPAVHQPIKKSRPLIAGTTLVVLYGRDRDGLVLADETVAADAKDGDILRHGESGGEAGTKGTSGIRIVVGEKSERLGSLAQLLAEPSVKPGEVVEPIQRRFFGENPFGSG